MNKKLLLLIILLASAMGLKAQGGVVSFNDQADGPVTLSQGANINSHYAYSGSVSPGNLMVLPTDSWRLQFGTPDQDLGFGATGYSNKWVIEAYDGAGTWWVVYYNNTSSSPAPPTSGWADATGGMDAISGFSLTLTATTSQTNVSCNGASNGTATVTASGGTAPYTYSWSPSGGTAATANGLAVGVYMVTVTDAASNSTTKTVTITQPTAITISGSSQTNVACNGSSTGSASVTVSGGTAPYTYSWSPSGGTAATASGLAVGVYTVTITDANACTKTKTFTITQPPAITISSFSQTNVACNGSSTGAASVTVSGGTGPYTYSWSPSGGAAATATGLSAGVYTVTITDANSCTKTKSFTITQPTAISIPSSSQTNVACNGASTGAASVTVSGGTGPYTYSWSPSGGIAATATGLAAGVYTVTITDANSCTATRIFDITQPTAITATTSETDATLYGGADGTASINASGGTPPYSYSWSPAGGTGATATGLTTGNYFVTVTDANSCQITSSVVVSQPAPPSTVVSVAVPSNGTYTPGQNLSFTVNFSNSVVVTGTPQIALVIGSTTRWASYLAGSGTSTFTFGYTVANGDFDNDGITVGALNLNGGTIKTGSTDADLTLNSVSSTANVLVDGILPALTTSAGSAAFVAGDNVTSTPVAVDAGITVADAGSATLATATVAITGGFSSGDVLAFTNTSATTYGDISASYNSGTGVLALASASGTATLAQWQSALRSITFTNLNITPNTATRTISFTVNDPVNSSNTATRTVTVTATDQTPIVTTTGGTTTYSGTPVIIDNGVTPSDLDNTTLQGATVKIFSGLHSGDVLAFTNNGSTMGNIAGSYNNVTGALTLMSSGATATLAQWQSALRTVAFSTTSIITGNRTISFVARDGSKQSAVATKTVNFIVITLSPASLPNAQAGAGYSQTVSASGGTAPYSYAVTSGVLPAGLTFSSGGALSGTPTAVGTFNFTVTATDAASGTGSQAYSLTVNAPTLTLSPISLPDGTYQSAYSPVTFTAGGGSAPYTYSVVGLPPGMSIDANSGTLSGTPTAAGTYSIAVTAQDATTGNGAPFTTTNVIILVIDKARLTITADANNKSYGAPVPTFTATYSGFVGGDGQASLTIAPTFVTTATSASPVGTYPITLSGAVDPNYAITYVGNTLTVNPVSLTVTADAQSKVYGSANPTFTASYSGFVNGDTEASLTTLPILTTTATTSSPVGNYAITASGAVDANYLISYTAGNLTVNAATLTIAADNQTKNYGDADPALTYQITSGSLAGTDAFTGSLTRAAGENVGTYAIQQGTLALSSNYNLTFTGANLTIGTRAITVTADAQSKNYGDADPALTYQITSGSLAGSDAFTGSLTRTAGENVGTYAIQQGTLKLNNNYNLTFTGANLTIGARAITVTADAKSKNYGDADPALTYQITSGSLVTGDSFSGSLTRAAGENVGTYAIQHGTLTLNNNYNLTFTGANLMIGARAITVTADTKNKNYGDADPALTYQITSGSLAGTDAFTGALTRAAGENVGTYAIQQGTLALSGNYNLTYTGANLTIGTRAIAVTADAKSKNYGDADPALTYQITSGGLAGSDAFTGSLTRAAGENVGTYAIQQGTLALSSNYNLTYTGANLTISARAITVTADAKSKNYGDADPALTYQITSGSLVGTEAFTGALTRVAGENVGTYAIQQGTLALSSNYNLTYTGASLTVNKATLDITVNSLTKAYGQANPALTITYAGFVNGDDASKLTVQPVVTTTAVTNSAIGTYPITVGGAASLNYNISYVPGSLTVTAASLTITADNQAKIYGEANPTLTAHYTGFINGDDASKLTTVPSLTTAASASSAAGDYTITASGAVIPNYTIVYQSGTLTINKAQLTVTADNQSRTYGAANPQLTVSYTGFVNGDDASKLTTAAIASTAAVAGTSPGTYPITVTGAVSPNYTFTYVPGMLTIAPLTDDNLSGLSVNQGRVTLSPDFAPDVYSYSATVENQVDRINVTALFASTATAQINGGVLYNNSPSADVPLHTGNNSISITITAQNGSQHTYTISIYRGLPASSITATNILTPNGDGKNDTWQVKDINLYPDNTVSIYDRAGRLVYSKHGYQNDWDGTLKGAPLGQGTYFYTIDLGNGGNLIKGFITIIREQ